MPYLALPVLTGFLRSHGIEVIQRDLNLETYDTVLSRANLEQALNRLHAEFPQGRHRTLPEKIEWAFAEGPHLAAQINTAKDVFRSPAFYEGEKSLAAFSVIMQSLELASLPFHPAQLDFLYYTSTSRGDSSRDLLQGVRDAKHNLFLDLFKRGILADIVRDKPDIVGISIPTEGQMLAAMTLAYLVKQTGLNCHITIGGPHVSMLREQIPHAPRLFDLIDSAVIFDGEEPLLQMAKALESNRDLSHIPNLIYRDAEQICATEPTSPTLPYSHTPAPDFDGLPLERYFVPELVLPLVSAHGCYHGLCAFCNVGYGAGKGFAPMQVEQLIEQITTLQNKYGVRYIFFTDEAMPPRTMRLLSTRLAEIGSPINWCTCARFEKVITSELLQTMARGGCRMVFYGLETASERMVKLIVKGTEGQTVSRILKEGTAAGIWNHTFLFFGFPTETIDDAQDTVNFLYAHQDSIHSAGVGTFVLERYSPVHLDPTRYGVTRIIAKPERDLAIYFDYELESGMDESMAKTVLGHFVNALPDKRFGQYYTHDVHRFLFASHLHAQGKPYPVWLTSGG
ncbi:MAG: radical SAM protein [Chloroflexi bacterium]|nr:radical SAM protein [Chloroflexota bacterium]